MTSSTLNPTVLEPLFAPWQEPNAHRVRAEKPDDPAVVKQGRRASLIEVVNNLQTSSVTRCMVVSHPASQF
ncbi:hypothetical protein [Leptolyngbya sp. 'hensonii']|uniref:hypothetical protein n=1 Tax=Leptolyngbya sp. 'hensonii' TaxID=1922337 RepID=UPI000A8CCE1B|nr:hypothetical protein [Leptolyngbya sp. 'hensonii']